MRLVYFSRDFTTHDQRFLSFLAGTGHEVFYLRLERKPGLALERPLPPAINTVDWLGGRQPFRFSQTACYLADLRRVFGEIKPDLVHAGPIPQTAFLAAKAGFNPLVSMSWGSDLLLESKQIKAVESRCRYTLTRTQVLLGDCAAVRERAGELGFPVERTVLFPWGINLEHFVPGRNSILRSKLGWQENFVLLSLRAWEPIYGVDLILSAFTAAVQQVPELRLILLGNGSRAEQLKSIIHQHHLQDKIYLGGTVANEDLPEIYQAADLYLSASYSDGSSVSLMEALACGLPALVSDIPGNREWVQHGKHGWLFSTGESNSLARGILHAHQSKAHLSAMGKSCRELALERADQTRNFPKLLEAYEMARSHSRPLLKGDIVR